MSILSKMAFDNNECNIIEDNEEDLYMEKNKNNDNKKINEAAKKVLSKCNFYPQKSKFNSPNLKRTKKEI